MTLVFYLIVDVVAIIALRKSDLYIAQNKLFKTFEGNRTSSFAFRNSSFFTAISFLILFTVASLRDNVGTDYATYTNAFLKTVSGSLTDADRSWLSIGYQALCHIVGFFDKDNYRLMFAVVAFITLMYFYKAFNTLSNKRHMSLYLLICFCLYYQTFNQIRQMMALAIATYAYRFIKEKETIKFFLYIALATLIHTSAIVVCVIFFVQNWKISFKNLFIYCTVAIVSVFCFDFILYLLSFTNYGATYLGWLQFNTSFEKTSIFNLVIRIILLIGCLIFSNKTISRVPHTRGLYNAVIICTILQILTLQSYLFGRVTTYFFIFYIFLIPEVMISIEKTFIKRDRFIIYMIFIILFTAYHFIYYFSSKGANGSGYGIYQTFIF